MPHEADDEQIGLVRLDIGDDGRHGVAGDHLGVELDALFLGNVARLRQDVVELVIFVGLGLDHLVDRSWHVRQHLDRDHVQRGAGALGDVAGQGQRLEAADRSVIGHHDPLEHVSHLLLGRRDFR